MTPLSKLHRQRRQLALQNRGKPATLVLQFNAQDLGG